MRPASAYIDQSQFDREMAAHFLSGWVGVGRSEDLPETGSFVQRSIAGEKLLLVRGPDQIRAFHNVCRHRGTQLCSQGRGHFVGSIQCSYHAWTWGLDGRLRAAPHFSEDDGFRLEDFPLHSPECAQWGGHLFVNLSKNPAPLEDGLGSVMKKFAPWPMENLRIGHTICYDVAANWKLIIQNYSECLHCPTVHPALARLSHYMTGDNEPATQFYLGGTMKLNDGVKTMTMSGESNRAIFSSLGEYDRRHIYYYALIPNMLLSLHPDYVVSYTLWPKAPNRTEIVCDFQFDPVEMRCPGFSAMDAVEFWDLTNRQDWRVSELSQLGMNSLSYMPGPYSIREGLLAAFDEIMIKALDGV